MTDAALHNLLARLADGDTSVVGEVRAALVAAGLGEVPVEGPEDAAIVAELLAPADGPGLLAPLAQRVDVADDVLTALFGAPERSAALAAAVAWEAGEAPAVDAGWAGAERHLAAAVASEAGEAPAVDVGWAGAERHLAAAVASEAGEAPAVDVGWAGVERRLPAAVRAEAGVVDVVRPVLAAISVESERAPVSAAALLVAPVTQVATVADVTLAAGPLDLPADAPPELLLSGLLDNALSAADRARAVALVAREPAAGPAMTRLADVGRLLREAVKVEGGATPYTWRAVAPAVGLADPEHVPGYDGARIAAALREEAGRVDVVAPVLAEVRSDLAVDVPEEVAPANQGWRVPWSAVAGLAAAAAVLVGVVWYGAQPGDQRVALEDLSVQFAAAGEVNVDFIHSGPDANVFVEVPTGTDAPLIIWVDDPQER